MQFFISHLASWLRNRRFSEPTFRPPGASNRWRNTALRDFPTFSRTWIFFSADSFSFFFSSSSLTLPISAFHLFHIVGSLTSKLPSILTMLFDCDAFWACCFQPTVRQKPRKHVRCNQDMSVNIPICTGSAFGRWRRRTWHSDHCLRWQHGS